MTMVPLDIFTRHTAVLGNTGAGKTSALKSGMVEPILKQGGRVLVIDPTSMWWGLRLSADGKRKGFPIHIFGGDHGDYPLRPENGSVLAEAFGTSSDSAIFDTSHLNVSDRCRFFIDFSTVLLRRNKGPVHLVIDEAHLFMPQAGAKVGGQVPAMLHAGNNLVSLGRSKGLRVAMLTQRPAKLHKDSLTQAQVLLAMRVFHPLDRRAVEDWIGEQADAAKGKEIVSSLASLKTGEAWVWAPLNNMLERVQFSMPKTFDSSKAPDENSEDAPKLEPIDLGALTSRLSVIEAEKKANDPKVLKAEIARLSKMQAHPLKEFVQDIAAIDHANKVGFAAGYNLGRGDGFNEALMMVKTAFFNIEKPVWKPMQAPDALKLPKPVAALAAGKVEGRRSAPIQARLPAPSGDGTLNSAANKMLAVLDTNPPVRRSWQQVATLAGLRARGGHFNTGKKGLVESGLIEESNGLVAIISPSGQAANPSTDPADVVKMWEGNLSGAAPKILRTLFDQGAATREEIAERLGMQPRGGHWNSAWKELRDNDIVQFNGSTVQLTELFQ